jgi:NAD+ synthase (glutamine-hydrolysing)
MKICLIQSNPSMGDLNKNYNWIKKQLDKNVADLYIIPEMALIGYPPDDLLCDQTLINKQLDMIKSFKDLIKKNTSLIIGGISVNNKALSNSAFYITKEKINIQNKISLPNYGVFDEKRYFYPGNKINTFVFKNKKFCILICEDFWSRDIENLYFNKKIDFIFVINASPYELNKFNERLSRAIQINKKMNSTLIYLNMIGGQDDLVFDGDSFIINQESKLTHKLKSFETDIVTVDLDKANTKKSKLNLLSEEELIIKAIILGTKDYLQKNNIKSVYLGLSGGIDSAIVAYIASKVLPSKNINCVMLRSKFTSKISIEDAKKLTNNLSISFRNKNIEPLVATINRTLKSEFSGKKSDITEENIQARSRALLLMALANKNKAVVLSTSNKSESAIGYSTLYGDMVGAYAPLKDIPKTTIYKLANFINKKKEVIPQRIIIRAPSAELSFNQKDQDSLPPYEILDKIIELFIDSNCSIKDIIKLGFKPQLVKKIVKLILGSEFKRRQSPPGPKITKKAFGRDRRYPITNNYLG